MWYNLRGQWVKNGGKETENNQTVHCAKKENNRVISRFADSYIDLSVLVLRSLFCEDRVERTKKRNDGFE